MTISTSTDKELWKLRAELMRPFRERDTLYKDRRRVRYRQMDQELSALPLNPRVQDTALMVYQSEEPNQEAHKRTKRLIANRPKFEVVLRESGDNFQELGQDLENGLKALYNWMNRGKPTFEWKLVEHQQGDGLGIAKVEFLPDHGESLAAFDLDDLLEDDEDGEIEGADERNSARTKFKKAMTAKDGDEEAAFDDVVQGQLRTEMPPFRLTAVDPLNCYWWEDDDGVAVMCETGEKALNPLLEAYSDYGIRFDKKTGKLFIDEEATEAVGTRTYTPPPTSGNDLSQRVEYTEIRTRENVFILIDHPKLEKKKQDGRRAKGIVFRFPNPFGPYTTGYTLVPGDVTTEEGEELKYQPVIEGILSIAQPLNVLMTARLSASLEEALSPLYIEPLDDQPQPPAEEEKTPEVVEGRNIPTVAGKLRRAETPNADLNQAEGRLLDETSLYRMSEAQLGEATSETSGHRLAIQVGQADIQMTPYQNTRKWATEELMKGIIYAVRKHGLPIYIPTLPDSGRKKGDGIRVSEAAKITPEMADLPFDLIITLGAETPVTKYSKWEALARRMEQGTAGYQTVVEQSDTEDPDEEIARVFEGRLLMDVMAQLTPVLAELAVAVGRDRILQRLQVAQAEEAEAAGGGMVPGMPPESGLAGGGGAQAIEQQIKTPGNGMPLNQQTSDFGPASPEGIEVGTS